MAGFSRFYIPFSEEKNGILYPSLSFFWNTIERVDVCSRDDTNVSSRWYNLFLVIAIICALNLQLLILCLFACWVVLVAVYLRCIPAEKGIRKNSVVWPCRIIWFDRSQGLFQMCSSVWRSFKIGVERVFLIVWFKIYVNQVYKRCFYVLYSGLFCLEKSPSNLRADIKSEHLRCWVDWMFQYVSASCRKGNFCRKEVRDCRSISTDFAQIFSFKSAINVPEKE